jgi:hypothetical protein
VAPKAVITDITTVQYRHWSPSTESSTLKMKAHGPRHVSWCSLVYSNISKESPASILRVFYSG